MERIEFIQKLFIAAMSNPQIVHVGLTVENALEDYDNVVETKEPQDDQPNDDSHDSDENDYYYSLEEHEKALYKRMQEGEMSKKSVQYLCEQSKIPFRPTWDEIITTDAVINKPELKSCHIRKWEKQADGHYGYTVTDKTTRRAVGGYSLDTFKVCKFLLSKHLRRPEFIQNFLKYNS